MSSPRDVLTPDNLAMLQAIADTGSFAAAARQLDMVPSALTYRVRQMEQWLDVLLFDRSARQAKPTEAGSILLHEGQRLLHDMESVAHRVKRVATGWEPQLHLVADDVTAPAVMLDLVQAFDALQAPTQLKLSTGTLGGPLESLLTGHADIALGVTSNTRTAQAPGVHVHPLGVIRFVFAVAPQHPLASATAPITDAQLLEHRLVVAADSAQRERRTIGVLHGQSTLTVDSLPAKIAAQVRGLGCGFLPEAMAAPWIAQGRLVAKAVERPAREIEIGFAWKNLQPGGMGKALQWWLEQLQHPITQQALLHQHRLPHLSLDPNSHA